MVSHRAPIGAREVPKDYRLLIGIHEAAAKLRAEANRRALSGLPLSDVSAQVQQLIYRVRAIADEWQHTPDAHSDRIAAANHCDVIIASLEGLHERFGA